MSAKTQLKKEITEAIIFLREHNHTIPSETIEYMKQSSLSQLEEDPKPNKTFNIDTKVKMLLFCKWMAICYADEHLDNKNRHTSDPDFNRKDQMSVLNREDGEWYMDRLKNFESVAWENYVKNGSVKSHKDYLKNMNK